MTLFHLLEWVLFYSIVGAFLYIPLYSVFITDTDWGWDCKPLAFFVAYFLPVAIVAAVVGAGWSIVQFLEWSKTIVLW